jgi:3-isopropylmalate/(R)-2-methylmalate dehydratase large subunit
MPKTMIEKILGAHAGRDVVPGDMVDILIDARVARDFGGANVVKNLVDNGLGVDDSSRTFFTFDCNPGGSDQSYASNQQRCRVFAREQGIQVYDIDAGIGTHLAMDEGLVGPGGTLVSTDSHANILGAIGAFGQGMGDQDIAHAFAYGTTWFVVPPSVKITLEGKPAPGATPKDVTLALIRHFGANGLLGFAAEVYGPYVEALDLPGRVTLASMCTEMGGIIMLFQPNDAVMEHCLEARERFLARGNGGNGRGSPVGRISEEGRGPGQIPGSGRGRAGLREEAEAAQVLEEWKSLAADPGASYAQEITVDISGVGPAMSRPGHPEDVIPVKDALGTPVDSVFIGSCTNGRYEDMVAAARVLEGRKVAPGVVLKVVPATDGVWRRLLEEGIIRTFKDAGALVGNAGCGGCAAGQIGQNGPGEVTVSTGNRNFAGKQGKGEVYLASPETAAASAVAGVIATAEALRSGAVEAARGAAARRTVPGGAGAVAAGRATKPAGPSLPVLPEGAASRPTTVRGRIWYIPVDNIDTDMIFHNRYLTITDVAQMGQYTFDNLEGWEDFARKAGRGDIVVTGKNFGCGSSRQQAVDCFLSLGVAAVVAESFGAIYERNAVNAGFAILTAPVLDAGFETGEEVTVDFSTGVIRRSNGEEIQGRPFSDAQLRIYQRGGLLAKG